MARRLFMAQRAAVGTRAQAVMLDMCRRDIVTFVNDWCWTFDPRLAGAGAVAKVPFHLFPHQRKMLRWLDKLVDDQAEGLIEKSRDVGATWLLCCFVLHHWRFRPGFKTTVGANLARNVDQLGDPDCIFEKIRLALRELPNWLRPPGFDFEQHDKQLQIYNPANENVITGQAGENIGRGGRASLLWIDEAAHLQHSDRVDAATIATADTRLWVSSVYGAGNLFAKKALGGRIRKFTFHYRDDPRKTDEYIAERREATEPAIWNSEWEIDYHASVEGLVIEGKWVRASRELYDKWSPKVHPSGPAVGGLDVGGGGKGRSVLIFRRGPWVLSPDVWSDPDSIDLVGRVLVRVGEVGDVPLLNYDPIGVGQGVMASLRRAHETRAGLRVSGLNVGVPPRPGRVWPDGRTSKACFTNLKAELWWVMRQRFQATYEQLLYEQGKPGGVKHDLEDLILLPPDGELATQVGLPRWFRDERGRIKIESKEQLAKRGVSSPDYADALVLTMNELGMEPLVTAETAVILGELQSTRFDGSLAAGAHALGELTSASFDGKLADDNY